VLWTEGTGIPPDAYEPVSKIYTKIVSLANEFKLGRMPREDEVADWQGMEWELYLENLPRSVEASQVVVLIFLVFELFYFSLSTLLFFFLDLFIFILRSLEYNYFTVQYVMVYYNWIILWMSLTGRNGF
jgi:hypothetical protein